MSSSNSPTVVVFGGTGIQGGSVAASLLKDGSFRVRVATKNPNSAVAQYLQNQGAAIHQVDLTSKQQIQRVVQGADYIFLVTEYWSPGLTETTEIEHGKMVADVAMAADIKAIIFSSLEDTSSINENAAVSQAVLDRGDDLAPHFRSKAKIENYMQRIGLPTIILRLPFFFENFQELLPPFQKNNQSFTWRFNLKPDQILPGMSLRDIGPIVMHILQSPDKHIGKLYGLASCCMTMSQYMEEFHRRYPDKSFEYEPISTSEYRRLLEPYGCTDLPYVLEFLCDAQHCQRRVDETRRLYPSIQTFDRWLDNVGPQGFPWMSDPNGNLGHRLLHEPVHVEAQADAIQKFGQTLLAEKSGALNRPAGGEMNV